MRKDKELAVSLRREGKSYREIREALKIPLSTLSEWFRDEAWSAEIAKRLSVEAQKQSTIRIIELDRIRGQHLDRVYAEAREEAKQELQKLKYNPLFIAGVMLYWGEGSKGSFSGLKFVNSDPLMIEFFVRFLREACGIPIGKITANVLIYPDHEEKTTRAFWAKSSGIPWENFTKSVLIKGRHPVRRLSWGVCNVNVLSTYFREKMLVWLELLPRELMKREYYENIRSFEQGN
jgi:hypothetical protein